MAKTALTITPERGGMVTGFTLDGDEYIWTRRPNFSECNRPRFGIPVLFRNSTGMPKRGRLHSLKLGRRVQMYSSPSRVKPVTIPPRSGVMVRAVFATGSVMTYCSKHAPPSVTYWVVIWFISCTSISFDTKRPPYAKKHAQQPFFN